MLAFSVCCDMVKVAEINTKLRRNPLNFFAVALALFPDAALFVYFGLFTLALRALLYTHSTTK